MEMIEEEDAIFTGSLIDNVAYHYVNYEDFGAMNTGDDAMDTRYYLTAATLYAILIDSFSADIIVFLPCRDDSEYHRRVEGFYEQVFDFFKVEYLTLDGSLDENIAKVNVEIKRLQKEAYEQGRDNQELGKENAE